MLSMTRRRFNDLRCQSYIDEHQARTSGTVSERLLSERCYHVSRMIDLDSLKAMSRGPGRSAGQADVAHTERPGDVDPIDWDRLKLRAA